MISFNRITIKRDHKLVKMAKKSGQNQQPIKGSNQVKKAAQAMDWNQKFEQMLTKAELVGIRAANNIHKWFINAILLFLVYNMYNFSVQYNNYWRLRRDPNLPRQWLEE